MTDEHIDEQSWALLKELWETPVGRRWMLKAGLGSAVALGAELYARPAVAAAKRLSAGVEPAEYHFQLGSLPGVSGLVLVANGTRTALASHTRTTHAALRRSSALWQAADLTTLTHFAAGLELPNGRALLMTVLGRRGSQTVVVAQKWHVPAPSRSRLASTTYRLTGSMAAVVGSPRRLHELGIEAGRLRRAQHVVELARVVGVSDSAFGLVSVHPNIATVNQEQHLVTEDLITKTDELHTLAEHINSLQKEGRDYATYETAVGSDGTPYKITIPAGKSPELVSEFQTFKLNQDEPKLKHSLKEAVSAGITSVRDSKELGAVIDKPLAAYGQDSKESTRTWVQPQGVEPKVENYTTALKGGKLDVRIKNTGLNSGTYVAKNGELENTKVPLKIYNNYVRWISLYVQYLGKDGTNLSANQAATAPDTKYAKSLGLLPQVFTVLGVPLWDTNTVDVELEFPPGARTARILMGGLGADIEGNGWRQYFPEGAYRDRIAPTDEVLVPALLTGILTIGLNVFALATDIDIAVTWAGVRKSIQKYSSGRDTAGLIFIFQELFRDAATLSLTAAEAAAATVASAGATYEDLHRNNFSLSNLWNILLSFGSVIPKILFNPAVWRLAARSFFGEIAVEVAAAEAAEKLIDAIPIIGQVIAVITAVGDVATLAEVCAETIVSPWVIENEVSLTYPVTVKIEHDPRNSHFPASAHSWRLQALVEGALTSHIYNGSVNRFDRLDTGPMFARIDAPFGGKDIQWSVVFEDDKGRQVGTGVSDKRRNDDVANPPSEVSIQIREIPVEITTSTVFKRKATTTYNRAAGGYEWNRDVRVTGTVHNKGVQEVADTAIATLAGVAGIVFKENDRFYIRGVPVADNLDNIKLGVARKEGFARRPFLLLAPFVESNDAKNHILLEPGEQTEGYQLRRLSIDPRTGDISWDPDVSLGTFTLPVSAAALHPSGRVVVVNTNHGRIGSLQPADTPRPQLASYVAGPGKRVGLLDSPIAVAITNPGVVLVLEAGTAQIAAFDLNGNPVKYFSAKAGSGEEYRRPLASPGRPLDIAVDGSDEIYVLYVTGDGSAVDDYRIDVYNKDGEVFNRASSSTNIPRLAVDYWRSIFGANYDSLTVLGTNTNRIDPRLGVAEPSLSRFDPTG